jgi:hypothetical protein
MIFALPESGLGVILIDYGQSGLAQHRAAMRFGGLVIDTVVCLTLAKWETVSGQFRGLSQ